MPNFRSHRNQTSQQEQVIPNEAPRDALACRIRFVCDLASHFYSIKGRIESWRHADC